MIDIVASAVLAVIVVLALRHLYKAKKNGATCVGCPSGTCLCGSGDPSEMSGYDCDCICNNGGPK